MNAQAIVERGYVTEEEYKALYESKKLEKLNIGVPKEGYGRMVDVEGIWVVPLEESNVSGGRFHFVFFNDPLHFWGGPRPTSGLVGIATSNGPNERATAVVSECLELFRKAGKPAIDYFHECAAKHQSAEKEKN